MLTQTQIDRATKFFEEHRAYVETLVSSTKMSYPPTLTEDKSRPELWKGAHWNWFLGSSFFR